MRRHDELVQVSQAVDTGRPEAFLWRGQLYAVREVLATWLERETWWESDSWDRGGRRGGDRPAVGEAPVQRPPLERRVWRVEATAGRYRGVGVYDLAEPAEVAVPVGVAPAGVAAGQEGVTAGATASHGDATGGSSRTEPRWRLLCRLD